MEEIKGKMGSEEAVIAHTGCVKGIPLLLRIRMHTLLPIRQ